MCNKKAKSVFEEKKWSNYICYRLIRVDRTGGSEESHSNSTTRPASAMEDYEQPHSR